METEEQVVPEKELSLRETLENVAEVIENPEAEINPQIEMPDRVRDETGKFAKTPKEKPVKVAKPVEGDAPAKSSTSVETTGDVTVPSPEASPVEPPQHWSEADKGKFKSAPAELQGWLLDRHKAMEADYTRKMQPIAELKREYEPVDQMFAPYKQELVSKGMSPSKLIQAWANAELMLNKDPINGLVSIARSYGITPQGLYDKLAGQPAQALPDPQIQNLSQELNTLKSYLTQQQQREQEGQLNYIRSEIDEFADEKDATGNLAHPHFDEVLDHMTIQAQILKAGGKSPTFQELYDSAVYANPSTRAKLLGAQQTAAQGKAQEQAKLKAASARKAGSSVSGSSTGSAPITAAKTLREELLRSATEVGVQ